jgi:hypothetical protein
MKAVKGALKSDMRVIEKRVLMFSVLPVILRACERTMQLPETHFTQEI